MLHERHMNTMINCWDYSKGAPSYGTEASYRIAASFLDGCGAVVEDWGCGGCGARKYFSRSRYIGIDGSGPYADVVTDLRERRETEASGILIRHVLEHNFSWTDILWNAADSEASRIAVVLFLEPRAFTELWISNSDNIPNLHVGERTMLRILSGFNVRCETVERNDGTPHKQEWLFLAERRPR